MSLKARWTHYAAKVNALSLRERGILFGSAMLVLGAAADSLVLSPAYAEQQQIKAKLAKLSNELIVLRAQVAMGHQPEEKGSPRAALVTAIKQTQQAKDAMDTQLKQALASPEQMARLPDLMAKVMRQQTGLTLARLTTAEPDQDRALLDKLTAIYGPLPSLMALSSTSTPATLDEKGVRMQGVNVGVIGPYLELARYLGDIERALPGLRWGELHLHAEPGSTESPLMEVRVYLMGASS